MSWARSFYLREWLLLYKHRRIMSSCLCSEWSLWSFSSKMSKMSTMLIMLTVITSDSSNQSNHFETLITQWLFNHYCYIISCKKVLTQARIKMSKAKNIFEYMKWSLTLIKQALAKVRVTMKKQIDKH